MTIRKIASRASLLLFSLFVASCADYDNGYEQKKLEYEKNFKELFGNIDPNQDWNMASQFYVNVTTTSDSRVKIYAHDGDTYKIVADYANVSGTKQLFFDAPKYIQSVLVTDGQDSKEIAVGTSVTLSDVRSRATEAGGGEGTQISFAKNEDTSTFLTLTRDQMAAYTKVVPESNQAGAHLNWGKVTENFTMIGTGEEYILYPMFWDSNHTNTLGIYYYDGAERRMVDIYTDRSGDEVMQYIPASGWSNETDGYMYQHYLDEDNTFKQKYTDSQQPTKWQLKGIKVFVPKGLSYGFYIRTDENYKFFSADEENTDEVSCTNIDHHHSKTYTKIPHAATFVYEGRKYYCFEDWNTASSDGDLNDFNFIISGNATTVDEEAYNWTIACEDLGNTDDVDFNDVVLNIQHISGQNTASVRALAAGGSMATHVMFKENDNWTDLGEIHHLLNPSMEYMESGKYPMLNTYEGYVPDAEGTTKTITVPEDWSLSSFTSESVSTLAQEDRDAMGGFKLMVLTKGISDKAEFSAVGTETAKYVNANVIDPAEGAGAPPQMICIQSPYKYTYASGVTVNRYWGWPTERTSIKEAYSGFSSWVNDMSSSIDWYKRPAAGMTAGQVDVGNIGDEDQQTETITPKPSTLALYAMPDSEKGGHKNYAKTLDASSGAEWELPINTASDAKISYASSDENVATVDADGKITVHTNGNAAITITQLANKYYEAGIISIDITAEGFASPNLQITSSANPTLEPGNTYTITWTSDNSNNVTATYSILEQTPITPGESVVSISGNVVTAEHHGTATIRVAIPANGTYLAEYKDVTVTVADIEYDNGKTFDLTPTKTDTKEYWSYSVNEYRVTVGNMNVSPGTTATITDDATSTDQIQWYGGNWDNGQTFNIGPTTSTVTVDADKIINKTFQIVFWRVADPGLGANSVHITFSE